MKKEFEINGCVVPPLRKYLEGLESVMNHAVKFSITWNCNETCGHCGYSCGPDMPMEFIPKNVIFAYFGELARNPAFKRRGYCISGGEPTLAYDHDVDYLSDIFQCGMYHKLPGMLKTNAGIVGTPHYERFIEDLKLFRKCKNGMNVSLSADDFHNNIDKNIVLMRELYENKIFKKGLYSDISCCENWFKKEKNIVRLLDSGLPVEMKEKNILRLGKTEIRLRNSVATNGRGANIPGSMNYEWENEFYAMLVGEKPSVSLHFMPDGKVSLEPGFDNSIVIDYRASCGKLKTLERIQRELVDLAVEKLGKRYEDFIVYIKEGAEKIIAEEAGKIPQITNELRHNQKIKST